MSGTVLIAVLAAALLHASWNAIVKGGSDKLASVGAVIIGHAVPAALALAVVAPPAPASWPWIGLGVALHLGYQGFLIAAYRLGDFSRVYPVARGSAPMIVALVSTTLLGVTLGRAELLAVLLIALGILSIGLTRDRAAPVQNGAVAAALVTGCFIAAYSLADGLGARLSGSPVGFYAWIAILNAVVLAAVLAVRRPGLLPRLPRHSPAAFWIGGPASFAAYALVVWAFTQAPIALVTALRETSIVFALLIGALVLRERIDLARIASVFVTLAGIALLRLSGR